jgi:predicted dehydrogenase
VRRVRAQLLKFREETPPLDAMSALYEFANGASGTLATVRATPFYWRVHAFGSNGSAEVLGESELLLRLSGKPQQKIVFDTGDSLRAELEAFADAVEGIAPYPITPEQILATVGAFEATVHALQDRGQDRN